MLSITFKKLVEKASLVLLGLPLEAACLFHVGLT